MRGGGSQQILIDLLEPDIIEKLGTLLEEFGFVRLFHTTSIFR
jgi:hypothetical protein